MTLYLLHTQAIAEMLSQALKNYLTQNGDAVITGVTLNASNSTTAVADTMVKLPDAPPFIVEAKTEAGAQFTYSKVSVYSMAQVGGDVSSSNAFLGNAGLTPGELLPALVICICTIGLPPTPVFHAGPFR